MTSQAPLPLSRRTLVRAFAAGAVLAVAAGGTASAASAAAPTTAEATAAPLLDTRALQAAISDLDHPHATSAQLYAFHGTERWYGTAGVAELGTGRAPRPGDRFRAGSVTKAFVATVVLQLWREGRLKLDAPLARYLPGLLPDDFGRRITVAHLLHHTSGLPDHQGIPDTSTPEGVLRHRFDRWTPREWVRTATHGPLKFAPGTKQEYRGINYVLLALVVEEVTGRPYREVITERVLRPLGLSRTLTPGQDPRLHGPHVHGYLRMTDGSLEDITVYNTSSSWGEGDLVCTVDDLVRFQQALFNGELLPPEAMDKLCSLPPDDVRMLDGGPARYGMGLQTVTVNGVTFWGKTGEVYGYRTRVFSTRDTRDARDRRLGFVLSYTPTPLTTPEQMVARVATALTS
ncbi:serine hydrolase domain-containing protein [Streptomyces lincolnensis]|nr:serine hydrolase domain-containing protein [Streptomyces lincolnensis]QMV06690.1 serine hydrolase [Streptomyces lincolnensis]